MTISAMLPECNSASNSCHRSILSRAKIAKPHRDLGATMICVTHDLVETMTMADKIVVLEAENVRHYGTPLELYHLPQNKFDAGFIGSLKMNFMSATATRISICGRRGHDA